MKAFYAFLSLFLKDAQYQTAQLSWHLSLWQTETERERERDAVAWKTILTLIEACLVALFKWGPSHSTSPFWETLESPSLKREQHSLNNPNPTLKDFGTLVSVVLLLKGSHMDGQRHTKRTLLCLLRKSKQSKFDPQVFIQGFTMTTFWRLHIATHKQHSILCMYATVYGHYHCIWLLRCSQNILQWSGNHIHNTLAIMFCEWLPGHF